MVHFSCMWHIQEAKHNFKRWVLLLKTNSSEFSLYLYIIMVSLSTRESGLSLHNTSYTILQQISYLENKHSLFVQHVGVNIDWLTDWLTAWLTLQTLKTDWLIGWFIDCLLDFKFISSMLDSLSAYKTKSWVEGMLSQLLQYILLY